MLPIKLTTNIPVAPSVGSFGSIRKYDVHTGIDLYCKDEASVYAIENGVVINICDFTGIKANSPWWEDTKAILIKGKSGVILYGELSPLVGISDEVKEGNLIGKVKRVLKKDKNKPMSMLHLELYDSDYFGNGEIWNINEEKPSKLKDPTNLLLE